MLLGSSSSIIIPESYEEIVPPLSAPSLMDFSQSQASQSQFQTQTQTQNESQLSNENSHEWPIHLWGILISLSNDNSNSSTSTNIISSIQSLPPPPLPSVVAYIPRPARLDLDFNKIVYKVGRLKSSDLMLNGKKVSSLHCEISVEQGVDGSIKCIRMKDLSTNGTYVRGVKVGKGNTTLLQSGDEIIFGPPTTSFKDDFRYSFSCAPVGSTFSIMNQSIAGIAEVYKAYELREMLGKGSFAVVHRAVERKTGRLCAIKIINKMKFQSDPVTMAMFRREIEIMKDLDHPYCIGFIDFYENEQNLWLVLEYSDGGDLLTYIMDRKGLKESDTRQIALMVCTAVAYLHSRGIAHRDIKPENILMSKGVKPICKVADFGLAKMIDAGSKFKTMCGTVSYLAPEIILGNSEEGYSNSIDAWSLGVVIYSCLTNSTPFDESESTPLKERIKARVVDFTHLKELGVSAVAIDFLNKFLTAEPTERMSVTDSLKHPWLATNSENGSNSLKSLVSSLPSNSRSQNDTTGMSLNTEDNDGTIRKKRESIESNNTRNTNNDLLTATGENSSFGYSQQMGGLQLGQNRSSLASSLHSTTTPGDQTMEEESIIEVGVKEGAEVTGNLMNEVTFKPTSTTSNKNNPGGKKKLIYFESIISPLGKRKERDEENDEEEEEEVEPDSAFSSNSSLDPHSSGSAIINNNKNDMNRRTIIGNSNISNFSALMNVDNSEKEEKDELEEEEEEEIEDFNSEGGKTIEGNSMEVEDIVESSSSTRSTRSTRSRKVKVVVETKKKVTVVAKKKTVVVQAQAAEVIVGDGVMTRRKAKAARLS